jgi:hypothetical protein
MKYSMWGYGTYSSDPAEGPAMVSFRHGDEAEGFKTRQVPRKVNDLHFLKSDSDI